MTTESIRAVQDWIAIVGRSRIIHKPNDAEYFESLYKTIFPGQSLCTTCPGVLSNAIDQVLNLSTIKIKQMANGKFTMGDGVIDTVYSPIEGVPLHVTKENLTDEIAEKLLKSNPNFKNQIFKTGKDESDVEEPKAKGKGK